MGSVKDYFSSLTTGFISLVKGMTVTGKEFVTKKVTEEYPDNRNDAIVAERFRAVLTLKYDDSKHHKCIACGFCHRNCPNGSIEIVKKVVATPDGKKRQKLDRYIYNLGSCTFCRLCVTTCPQDALEFSNDFEQAVFSREKLFKQLNYLPEPEEDILPNAEAQDKQKPAEDTAAAAAPKADAPAKAEPAAASSEVVTEVEQSMASLAKLQKADVAALPAPAAAKLKEKAEALQKKIDRLVESASAQDAAAIVARFPQLASKVKAAPEPKVEEANVAVTNVAEVVWKEMAKLQKLQKADINALPAPAAAKLKEKLDASNARVKELMANASPDELKAIVAQFPQLGSSEDNKN